jgi:hypothetical protein
MARLVLSLLVIVYLRLCIAEEPIRHSPDAIHSAPPDFIGAVPAGF